MKKIFILGILLLVILLVGAIGSIWLVFAYLPARNIQMMIDAPDWKEFKYQKLGYSFIAPESWTTEEIVDNNGYQEASSSYRVSTNAYPKTLINIVFHKNPDKDRVESILNGATREPKTRTINGIEYTVTHYQPRLDAGYKAGNYLLSKDKSLLIEARAAFYPSELSSLEIQKEEELVNKILNSVKKI